MTTHPERRAGQTWKWERNGTVFIATLKSGEGYDWAAKGNDGSGVFCAADWNGSNGATMTLIADVPAVAPVAAGTCKAPEGYVKCPGAACQRFYFPRLDMIDGGCMDCKPGRQVADWTPTPPLAAHPSETKSCNGCCMTSVGTMDRPVWTVCVPCGKKVKAQIEAAKAQPAQQPKPAKLPVCGGCGAEDSTTTLRYILNVTKPVLRCDVCMHSAETRASEYRDCGGYEPTGILRDPAIPERIARPKLSHSSQWADEAEDVR